MHRSKQRVPLPGDTGKNSSAIKNALTLARQSTIPLMCILQCSLRICDCLPVHQYSVLFMVVICFALVQSLQLSQD